jgi:hypothetical protein
MMIVATDSGSVLVAAATLARAERERQAGPASLARSGLAHALPLHAAVHVLALAPALSASSSSSAAAAASAATVAASTSAAATSAASEGRLLLLLGRGRTDLAATLLRGRPVAAAAQARLIVGDELALLGVAGRVAAVVGLLALSVHHDEAIAAVAIALAFLAALGVDDAVAARAVGLGDLAAGTIAVTHLAASTPLIRSHEQDVLVDLLLITSRTYGLSVSSAVEVGESDQVRTTGTVLGCEAKE